MPIESIITCPGPSSPANIFVQNGSLDIAITGIFVDGIPVTYSGGSNFPVTAGNNGDFSTNQTGSNQTVSISYNTNIPGQNIYLYDSSFFATCHDVNGQGGSFSVFNVFVSSISDLTVNPSDGMCF